MGTGCLSCTVSFKECLGRVSALGKGEVCTVSGLYGSSRAYLVARYLKGAKKPSVVVLPTDELAERFFQDIVFFLGSDVSILFPSTGLLPFERQNPYTEVMARRLSALHRLLVAEGPTVVVTSIRALRERLIPRLAFMERVVELKKGGEEPRERLLLKLQEMGYRKMTMVEDRGEMSVRGFILDLFPPVMDNPVRIEFFGDQIESIRTFDLYTQRSLDELEGVTLLPLCELDLSPDGRELARKALLERVDRKGLKRRDWEPLYNATREGIYIDGMAALLPLFYRELETLFHYLPEEATLFVVDPTAVSEECVTLNEDIKARAEEALLDGEELYLTEEELHAAMKAHPTVRVEPVKTEGLYISTSSNKDISAELKQKKELSPLKRHVEGWLNEGLRVYLTAHNSTQAERMCELFGEFPVAIKDAAGILKDEYASSVGIVVGTPSAGFRLMDEALVLVTEEEIFGERVKRRPVTPRGVDALTTQLKDIKEGEPVVHRDHGIGLYRGIVRLESAGIETDFILVEYRDGDRLYVPVARADLVSKYRGIEGRIPELDKLGSGGWQKKTGRVRKAVGEVAQRLFRIYMARKAARGHAFSPPDALYREFEAAFEYEETPDQLRAIEDVMRDMGEPRPMDRLVCGDVGYGKTEVAMRAAFRCVLDGKQVALVVPTTVLAQQHYLTFRERFARYPVRIDVLSRFRSRKEQLETLEELASGRVDIIIGTHRLLQKDVVFKDLGLLVIDEEHRFGVRDKERLKEIKKDVDVLTLTATPIPRTLHMSLAGIRDISVINTPPEDRLAITTRVIGFEPQLIKDAIERELRRGGQVFFVHNRVEDIEKMHRFLRELISSIPVGSPARIGIAHGQMKEKELEAVMLRFIEGEYSILLCTSIIESGLDIPRANTIIINRADCFGLAELYQLRGRVGRSDQHAYAYLICSENSRLSEEARKRMEVIRELTEPGSGFRIAMHDLEIRGAGEVFGMRQSGHIMEVGFDMYTKLLEDALGELKGELSVEEPEPEVLLRISQYVPEDYMPDARDRLSFYKRLAIARTTDELEFLKEELSDRYGRLPDVVRNLFDVVALKLRMKELCIVELSQKGDRLHVRFSPDAGTRVPELAKRLASLVKGSDRFFLNREQKLIYIMRSALDPVAEARYVLKELAEG